MNSRTQTAGVPLCDSKAGRLMPWVFLAFLNGASSGAPPKQAFTPALSAGPIGTLTWHLNRDATAPLGLRVNIDGRVTAESPDAPYVSVLCGLRAAQSSDMDLAVACPVLLETASSEKILDDLRLTSNPQDVTRATLRDSSGAVWFLLDHAHPEGNSGTTAARHANLKVGPALAEWMAISNSADTVIGGMDWQSLRPGSAAATSVEALASCTAQWASANNPARIRLMSMTRNFDTDKPDTIAFERCSVIHDGLPPSPCTNEGADGQVVFAPDASLINIGSSAVPWYGMFSGRFPPYDNDQHPFLIWNLYRVDGDGTLRQLGRSGVKHAFYGINIDCQCPGGHIVYPTCQDTYSSYNNDSLQFLGPRGEVIPSKGLWAPCGSVFDSDCDGIPGPRPPGQDNGHLWRMNVPENELRTDLHPGARYYFEYGYIIRDQIDPDSSFGFREVRPRKVPRANGFATWQLEPSKLQFGFVIDHWVDPKAHARFTFSERFSTAAGSGRIAVRVVALGASQYQYTYAVHNVDLVVAQTSGEGPRLRIDSARSINRIALPTSVDAHLKDVHFYPVSGDADWSYIPSDSQAVWHAADGHELSWGSVYTIRFVCDAAPRAGTLRLRIADSPLIGDVEVKTLLPTGGTRAH